MKTKYNNIFFGKILCKSTNLTFVTEICQKKQKNKNINRQKRQHKGVVKFKKIYVNIFKTR